MDPATNALSLRTVLRADAVTCLAMGALLALATGLVARLTGLSPDLVRGAGVLLVPIGLFMAVTAQQPAGSSLAAWLIVIGNAGWVAASAAVALTASALTPFGAFFIWGQAAIVALFAFLEWRALPR